MLKFVKVLVVAASFMTLSVAAQAENKIAVVNYQLAMVESDAAKAYAKVAEQRFGGQVETLKLLEIEAKGLQAKLERDGATMSESEKKKAQRDLQRMAQDFEYQSKQLQAEKGQADQQEIQTLRPRLEQAIQEVVTEQGIDLVLERGSVVFVGPKFDITAQVIEKMNKTK